jgi:hypothetical protein
MAALRKTTREEKLIGDEHTSQSPDADTDEP